MPLSEAELLRRLAVEVDAAGGARLFGLPVDALRPLVAAGSALVGPDDADPSAPGSLDLLVADEVAPSGALRPALAARTWSPCLLDGRRRRVVAVVLPASTAEPACVATGRALVAAIDAERAVDAAVERVITPDAVLDLAEGRFVLCELGRGISARQLQEHVAPSLSIRPTLTELSGRRPEEPR